MGLHFFRILSKYTFYFTKQISKFNRVRQLLLLNNSSSSIGTNEMNEVVQMNLELVRSVLSQRLIHALPSLSSPHPKPKQQNYLQNL